MIIPHLLEMQDYSYTTDYFSLVYSIHFISLIKQFSVIADKIELISIIESSIIIFSILSFSSS